MKSDASSLAALSIEVWLGTYIKRGVTGAFAEYALAQFTPENLENIIADPDEQIFVSLEQEGIKGYIRITQNQKAPAECDANTEISTFYIQPRHHGKGLGKALLQAALRHCKDAGASSVWLATNSENSPAIGFYLAQGFREVGHTHFVLNDQAYQNNVYCLRID